MSTFGEFLYSDAFEKLDLRLSDEIRKQLMTENVRSQTQLLRLMHDDDRALRLWHEFRRWSNG